MCVLPDWYFRSCSLYIGVQDTFWFIVASCVSTWLIFSLLSFVLCRQIPCVVEINKISVLSWLNLSSFKFIQQHIAAIHTLSSLPATLLPKGPLKPRPNDRNISTQHIAILLGEHVACVWPACCDVLRHVGQIFHATFVDVTWCCGRLARFHSRSQRPRSFWSAPRRPSPTPEVRDSRTSHHSAHVQSQVWQIWLVRVSIYCVYKAIQKRNAVGPGQRSRFLVLTKRSAASGDENGQVRATMLRLGMRTSSILKTQHVDTGWPNACNMLRLRMVRSAAFKCCDRLAGACKCWANNVGMCCVAMLLSFGRKA